MYTVLDTALNVVGFLSNKGRGANDFWGDTISQQIADTQDILGNVDLTVDNVSRNIDVSGNTKNWNHTLSGISFNNTPVGAQVENGYYLLYKDDATNRHYLMQLTSVLEKVTPGGQHYKTATGVNAALYDFSRMIVDAKEFYSAPTGTQTLGSLQNILKYLLGHAGWNVNLEDYNFPDVQYSISDNTSVQSVLQDIIKLFDVDVDAYVTLTPQGRLAKRVVEFRRTMGTDSGVTIRYGKNMTDMTREALSDSIYTKLYVQGANSLKISSVNNGLPYIVDESANKRYNPVGASSSPETFREGTVINSMITDARSLLAWGKKQLQALNHPRINYTISSIASTEAGLGDTIRVQDLYTSQQILLTSRVIQKTISFANPTINTLVLGEYSSVLGDKTKNVDLIARLDQVSNDVTVVSQAAVNNKVIAEAASNAATQANNAAANVAITASGISQTVASNDAKTTATFATLADQIMTEVANRKTGDSDTQTQLANLNSTVVKNSTGIATLTQTASAIQATVATKTDKSTVLQLFSDNFEAGIKANTGALIAGINADTSGTTIAGKHITLDGSVTVTGAFVSKALSTADATITKVLTIGSGGSIVNTYTKSGTFTGYSGQVSYSLSGKFTFNNSGISFGGTAKGPNAPTSTSGEVSQRGIPFVPTQWNASSVVNEALMQMSATAVKGYSVKSDVLASGDSSYLNLSAFNIQLNSGGYDTYIGPDMIMTDGQVQASAFTARGTSYFKNIEAGVVDSGPIRLNNAHTIFTTDGTTLYLAGGAQGGGAGVQVTDNFTVKGDMSVGTVNAGRNINVGWDVIKNGTGLHPDYFNNTLPGIHIMGTNSGIAWDIKNKLAYIIIENSYKGLGNNNTGTGKWKN